jgi:3-dehydroquinate synthase class II
MTGRNATLSMDGTPISQADIARMEEEERLNAQRQREATRVIAAAAHDADDCRMLLEMLGLGHEVVLAAREECRAPAGTSRRRSRAA